ncbi:nucleotide-binding protein [Anaerotruncus rubiinfantis]|uniref:nucleotide-binding protein n=1 Tax=Anaerotruncus rubiinfantis TaxID=1720200 RepID=UPI000AD64894
MTYEIPRLMIAAASSGSGKTTVTCALLRALIRRGLRPASFKCGPDYIDPMFHHKSIGTAFSSNLDLFLGDADTARYWLCRGARNADLAVIEGVMGFYDGLAAKTFDASSYDLARQTKTPVVLVVGCKGMSVSIAAQVKGFTALRPDANIQAVLLNQISPALYPDIKRIVEESCGVPVMGYLPQMPDCALESRHLGLVTAAEVSELSEKLDHLAGRFCETVEIERLLAVARARWRRTGLRALRGRAKRVSRWRGTGRSVSITRIRWPCCATLAQSFWSLARCGIRHYRTARRHCL